MTVHRRNYSYIQFHLTFFLHACLVLIHSDVDSLEALIQNSVLASKTQITVDLVFQAVMAIG